MFDYTYLKLVTEVEFSDIVTATEIVRNRKLSLFLVDATYIDVFYSPISENRRFAYHWERSFIDGTIYRHDSIPDGKWKDISTFPKHFHDGTYENVQESNISDEPVDALRSFLNFVRLTLAKRQG